MPPRRREATNVEVVIWSLALLRGGDEIVHLEDIAAKAFALKPGAFRWDQQAYAGYIDKDKVRVSLTDAAKAEYGALTRAVGEKIVQVSKPTDWWRLTPTGVRWVADNQARLSAVFREAPPALKREAARLVRHRLEASELFGEYVATGAVATSAYALADLIECSPDARAGVFVSRFENLQAQVVQLADLELEKFLEVVRQAHASILGGGVEDRG